MTLKHIRNDLKCILHYDLTVHKSPLSQVTTYIDADSVDFIDTRGSTSRYCIFLGDNLISWSSKVQTTIFNSNIQVEYHRLTNIIFESYWICNL